MNRNDELKKLVKDKYSEIALQDKELNSASCCGSGSDCQEVYSIMTDNYEHLDGYTPDADLGLGCGIPTEFAMIRNGDTVVDLGSGAGNDAFVTRAQTGPDGKIIGIDFTDAMIEKSTANAAKLGFTNVEFRKGDIEDMPLKDNVADVVISNCVLNLVPDKSKAFSEIYRILKTGGHFSISDIVVTAALPFAVQRAAELYAGCVSGAINKEAYLNLLSENGFENVKIQKEKPIIIPDELMNQYLDEKGMQEFKSMGQSIYSITVYGEKAPKKCCTASSCC
jgi:arsenite methyltransferase